MSERHRTVARWKSSRGLTQDAVEYGGYSHVSVDDVFSTVPLRNLSGSSLRQLKDAQPSSGLEIRMNEVLDEFGIPDGDIRTSVLSSYKRDLHYNSTLVRAAGKITREMGFNGDYASTDLNWQQAFISLTKFIHFNDELAARLVVEYTGLARIDEAAKRIRGYTSVQAEDTSVLIPRKQLDHIIKGDTKITIKDMNLRMSSRGYERQTYHGIPIYIKSTSQMTH
ncbi:MAG TPA: hypothetical protein VJJ52_01000 [Candidatus Nanoarchaeia archaeon]|nr:hypothetical protein [Candidatus Nanoarchaeia archaeon]